MSATLSKKDRVDRNRWRIGTVMAAIGLVLAWLGLRGGGPVTVRLEAPSTQTPAAPGNDPKLTPVPFVRPDTPATKPEVMASRIPARNPRLPSPIPDSWQESGTGGADLSLDELHDQRDRLGRLRARMRAEAEGHLPLHEIGPVELGRAEIGRVTDDWPDARVLYIFQDNFRIFDRDGDHRISDRELGALIADTDAAIGSEKTIRMDFENELRAARRDPRFKGMSDAEIINLIR